MNDEINVGIDCGELDIRVATVRNSAPEMLPLPEGDLGRLLMFDRKASISSIGVGFPGLLASLGTHRGLSVQDRRETPEALMTQRFETVNRSVIERTPATIASTVVAVPSSFSDRRRKTLLECLAGTGFDNATLLDKCTAAAIGFHGQSDESRTLLVLDMGYGDCEFSIVRLSKRRCRVVATGAVAKVSGQVLDAMIIEAMVLALRNQRIFLGLKKLSSEQWLLLRRTAEDARRLLADHATATVFLTPSFADVDTDIDIQMHRDAFSRELLPIVAQVREGIGGLLEQGQIDLSDVDSFLLIGDEATSPPVADMLKEAFDGRPQTMGPELVALGAAWRACGDDEPSIDPGTFALPTTSSRTRRTVLPVEIAQPEKPIAEVVSLRKHASPKAKTGRQERPALSISLSAIQQLVDQGLRVEALRQLDHLIEEAMAFREQLRPRALTGSMLQLEKAKAMLNTGDYRRAVAMSHEAYESAKDDVDVFAGMMKIHVEAGLRLRDPAEFDDSIRLLTCAHEHDQTDRSIHNALSRRYLMHAVAMRGLNNYSNAMTAVNLALQFDPKNKGAMELHEHLMTDSLNSE